MSGSALDYLNLVRLELAGRPITRSSVRAVCAELNLDRADDAYKILVNDASQKPQDEPQVTIWSGTLINDPSPILGHLSASTMHRVHRGSCPPSQVPVVKIDVLDWNPVAVFSDLHIPAHDHKFMERCVDRALSEGVKKFIIAGDLTDNNQWHKRTHGIRTERKWQDDIDLSRSVLAWLCANFEAGYLFFGNHDEWVIKMLQGQADSNWLYSHLYPNLPLTFSYKHQVRLRQPLVAPEFPPMNKGEAEWRIIHGEHFSQNPVATMEKYCAKFQANVLSGHMHWAIQAEYGPWQWVLNGGSFDESRQDYLHERPSNMKKTQQGFTVIKDGMATLYRGSDPRW